MNRTSITSLLILAIAALAPVSLKTTEGQQNSRTLPFQFRNKAGQNNSFKLTKNAGPWLIFCANFSAVDKVGRDQAMDLAKELKSYGLKAYIYEHKFEFGEYKKLGLGITQDKKTAKIVPKTMKLKNVKDYTDISVLIGDFPARDDRNALHRLGQIKQLKPRSLNYNETRQRMSAIRHYYKEINKRVANLANSKDPKENLGPMRSAFIVPNPLLPESAYAAVKDQSFLLYLNSQSKYSLLKARKKYTVKVATFKGKSYLNDNKIRSEQIRFNEVLNGRRNKKDLEETLNEASFTAENLVRQLRKARLEAYTYHDRGSSIVCVGSYDWIVRGEGKNKIINPNAQAVINKFKGQAVVSKIPGVPSYYKPMQFKTHKKGVMGNFDIVPVAIEIPQIKRR